ncbi:DoxX family protein [Mycobacterium sp. MYCO198283]|uniref:DoxX family protein n=1 Tax=Mycobacterium sp. MYCO198283 TaxID=2883505 RepID=UPI001E5D6F0D|nr:DoxX family protein [Mycobacterium sp. MYCO198283]MCG5430824.1 DoxX family protein [Mycobacterium sp. MYCO198283]
MTTTGSFARRSPASGDLGLLLLRIGVGAPLLHAGLRKVVDFSATASSFEQSGWKAPELATAMVSAAEVGGGALLLLGLLTPLAACAALGAMLCAWAVNVAAGPVWSDPFNFPFVLALGAAALLVSGAGSISLDGRVWGRPRWPASFAVALLLTAVGVAVLTWVVLNGVNPIHLQAAQPTGR